MQSDWDVHSASHDYGGCGRGEVGNAGVEGAG